MVCRMIVNNNGASRESLVAARIDARSAVWEAMKCLGETRPHGRDYQCNADPKGDYDADMAEFNARYAALDKMHNELLEEALWIQDGAE